MDSSHERIDLLTGGATHASQSQERDVDESPDSRHGDSYRLHGDSEANDHSDDQSHRNTGGSEAALPTILRSSKSSSNPPPNDSGELAQRAASLVHDGWEVEQQATAYLASRQSMLEFGDDPFEEALQSDSTGGRAAAMHKSIEEADPPIRRRRVDPDPIDQDFSQPSLRERTPEREGPPLPILPPSPDPEPEPEPEHESEPEPDSELDSDPDPERPNARSPSPRPPVQEQQILTQVGISSPRREGASDCNPSPDWSDSPESEDEFATEDELAAEDERGQATSEATSQLDPSQALKQMNEILEQFNDDGSRAQLTKKSTRFHTREILYNAWQEPNGYVSGNHLALLTTILHEVDPRTSATMRAVSKLGRLHALEGDDFEQLLFDILAMMPDVVIEGLIQGTLAELWQKDARGIQQVCTRFAKDDTTVEDGFDLPVPCIYLNVIVNPQTGKGLSRWEVRKMFEDLWQLTKIDLVQAGKDMLAHMNTYFVEHRTRGASKHHTIFEASILGKGTPEIKRKKKRQDIATFLNSIDMLESQLQNATDTMTFPEVGLTQDASSRLPQHHIFEDTNLILTLLRCYIGTYFKGYEMFSFIVAYVDSSVKLSVGEVLIAHLASSYITTGGCNETEVGQSDRFSEQGEMYWEEVYASLEKAKVYDRFDQNMRRYDTMIKLSDAKTLEMTAAEAQQRARQEQQKLLEEFERNCADCLDLEKRTNELNTRLKEAIDMCVEKRNNLIAITKRLRPDDAATTFDMTLAVCQRLTSIVKTGHEKQLQSSLENVFNASATAVRELWPNAKQLDINVPPPQQAQELDLEQTQPEGDSQHDSDVIASTAAIVDDGPQA